MKKIRLYAMHKGQVISEAFLWAQGDSEAGMLDIFNLCIFPAGIGIYLEDVSIRSGVSLGSDETGKDTDRER